MCGGKLFNPLVRAVGMDLKGRNRRKEVPCKLIRRRWWWWWWGRKHTGETNNGNPLPIPFRNTCRRGLWRGAEHKPLFAPEGWQKIFAKKKQKKNRVENRGIPKGRYRGRFGVVLKTNTHTHMFTSTHVDMDTVLKPAKIRLQIKWCKNTLPPLFEPKGTRHGRRKGEGVEG